MIGTVVTLRGKLGVDGVAREDAHEMELVARDGL